MSARGNLVALTLALAFSAACSEARRPPGERSDIGAASAVANPSAYLGQTPPGLTPELFAPGIISTDGREFAISFSPDGLECFFTKSMETNTLMVARWVDGVWTEPVIAPFSGTHFDFEPLFIPDGRRVYFGSRRPPHGSGESGEMHQWYIEKTEAGWSDPIPTGSPFWERFVMYMTHAANGNAYFTGDDGIYVSRLVEGAYRDPELLDESINHLQWAAHPFVAPDESYLLFDAQPVEGNADLFVSFAGADGAWGPAIALGEGFNTEAEDLVAFVSYDGRYLFFSRITENTGDIYWVDAAVIEAYREGGSD